MTTSVLAKKLLIRPGQRILLLGAPAHYQALLLPLPEGASAAAAGDDEAAGEGGYDAVHLFVRDRGDLDRRTPAALAAAGRNGLLWIAYPKGGAKAGTDLHRDSLRSGVESAHGWTAVTQVALDADWSALRFRPADLVGR
jgi:hypothetical protein